MSEVVALIPARSGSKGVPDKNIRLLGEHPLIAWSIMAAKKSKLIDRIIVSTDSSFYADIAKKYGAEVPFLRPVEISSDISTDYDFIHHAIEWLSIHHEKPKWIAHIRPTTPFRNPSEIDRAISLFKGNQIASSLRSAHEMSESAYKTFEINTNGFYKMVGNTYQNLDFANNARQLFSSTYQANGYIDVLSVEYILSKAAIHGDKVMPFITNHSYEVDTEDDFGLLEYQLKKDPYFFSQLFN